MDESASLLGTSLSFLLCLTSDRSGELPRGSKSSSSVLTSVLVSEEK